MYVEQLHTYGNIVSFNETINYFYQIKPINSLFAPETQQSTLIQNMMGKLLSINMPGAIIIRPRMIDDNAILKNYDDLWKKNGRPELQKLKDNHIRSMKKILDTKLKYSYDIFLVISDGREDLKRKRTIKITKTSNDKLDQRMLEVCQVVDEEIYKKLSTDLVVERLIEEKIEMLHNYLAIPVEGKMADYFTIPQATELCYEYKLVNEPIYRKLYSRTFIASEFKHNKMEALQANSVINSLQLGVYPVDTIIKFDMEHTLKFKREMLGKKEDIRKSHRRYFNSSDRRDPLADKAHELAKIGTNADESIEESKIRWQMMFRIRSDKEEMLNRRSDALVRKFSGAGVTLSYELGEQDKLANNLFPFKQPYKNHVQISDVSYFCHFNYLGGLYIGEENEGTIVTFTKPGELPILINPYAPIQGKSKSASPTSIFIGETGSGKSQLSNDIVMVLMIYYGVKVLAVDPKGDRMKLVQLLGGDVASHLILGSKDCQNGMFDAYLLTDDHVLALANAQRDITALIRAVNPNQELDFNAIKKADAEMNIDVESGTIDHPSMKRLVGYLTKHDKIVASQLEGLMDDPNARLFFADEDTDITKVFSMNKRYNLVTFEKVPLYSKEKNIIEFNPNEKDHRMFSILFARIQDIINEFMKSSRDDEKMLQIDEVKVFTQIPGAKEIITNTTRQARTWMTLLHLLSQRLSDMDDDVIEQTGQFFIGSLKSPTEIDFVLDFMKLSHDSIVGEILLDRTSDEGLNEDRKYNFLYSDYNNRKCVTKAIFPDLFKDAFDTFKKG